jgi:S1-C subfamily serine protease
MFVSFSQINNEKFVEVSNQSCQAYDANYVEGKTYEWDGSTKDDFADGQGVLSVFIKDTIYEKIEASFIKGVAEGQGKIIRPNEELEVSGIFKEGFINGPGKITKYHGYQYQGNLINDVAHGKGEMIYGNGTSFDGTFNSGIFWTGVYTDLQDNKIFYFRQDQVESIPKPTNYIPKMNTTLTEYFDENWSRCDKSMASYYRKITYESPNQPSGLVRDYFIDGTLQSEFNCLYIDYSDDNMNFHDEGVVTYYFNNGEVASERNYNLNNSYYGLSYFYHRNGVLKKSINYDIFGHKEGAVYSYDDKGDIIGLSLYENGELWKERYFEIENGFWSSIQIEDFEKNSDFWFETNKSSVFKDVLFFSLKEKEDVFYRTKQFDLDSDLSYSIYSEASVDKNQEFCLIFGYLNEYNYSSFNVSAKEFTILHYEKDELVAGHQDKFKRGKGVNSYNIQKFNDELLFYINDVEVYKCKVWEFNGTEAGVSVNGKGYGFVRDLILHVWFNQEQSEYLTEMFLVEEEGDANDGQVNWDGNGSGFFISNEGYIATNQHVIEGAKTIQVEYLENGEKKSYQAEVVISDKPNDLAILEITDSEFKMNHSIPYNLDFRIKDIGSDVFALGYPMADVLGDDIKYTEGTISSRTGIDGDISTYQISVPIQPGNSGGPLFDQNGNVVGITSSILNREMFDSENVNYAIKISYLKNLIDVLPKGIATNNSDALKKKSKTQKIKELRSFIPIIRVKL